MKIQEKTDTLINWGVFIETSDGLDNTRYFEVKLPDDLAALVASHLSSGNLDIVQETNGEILW